MSVCNEIFSELPDVYTDSCVKTTLQPVTTPLPADVCKQIKVTGWAHPVAAYGMGGTYTKSTRMHNGFHYWEAVSLFKSNYSLTKSFVRLHNKLILILL